MPSTAQIRGLLRFGEFELDVRSGELHKDGLIIRLADQPFRVLLLLVERAGGVVTREELQGKLWAADTFVDFDIGLNSVIRRLRDTLGDSADHPRFIETLPKRGYRFIASVKPATADRIPQPGANGTAMAGSRARLAWIAGGLVLAAAIGTLALALERGWWEPLRAGPAA